MWKSLRFVGIVLVAQAALLIHGASRAADVPREAFYGVFAGTAFTHGDVGYYEGKVRDLDVEIGAYKEGFFVAWTTVLRPPDGGKARRRSSLLRFVPSERPGIYVQQTVGRSVAEGFAWAAVKGKRLTIRTLAIQADGSYDIHTYHRTLIKKGMTIQFRSDHNGKTIRMVSGRLSKVSDNVESWLDQALFRAECGDPTAQLELGQYYQFSVARVPEDRTDAFFWYSLASRQGNSEAEGSLDLLMVEMSREQIVEAKRLVAEWKPADCSE